MIEDIISQDVSGRISKSLIACLLLSVALVGCQKSDRYLRVDPAVIELEAEELERGVVVETSAGSWVAARPKVTEEWLDFQHDTGGADVVWVKIREANESLTPRTSQLTIIAGDGLSLVVPIVHRAKNVHFEVTPRALIFDGRTPAPATLTVDTDITGWQFLVAHASDWLNVSRGEGADDNTLTVSAKPLRTLDDRRDTIVVRPSREAYAPLADSIPVVQRGLGLVVEAENVDPETGLVTLPAAASAWEITVKSKAPWRIAGTPPGITLDRTQGEADTDRGVALTITANDAGGAELAFRIVFESAGASYEYHFIRPAATQQAALSRPKTRPVAAPSNRTFRP